MRTIKYINQVSLVFPSRSANEGFARSAAASFAAQLDPTLDELGDVKTAVSEAVTNAIVHAYPDALGKVELKLRLYPENEFEVVVRDWGVGIENIDQARASLSAELGREPVLSELSQATGLTPEEIAEVDLATAPVASLQAETGEDGLSFEGVLGSDSPEESIVEKLALRTAIDALPERERQLILLRYFKGLTQDKTAKVLGISQVQVSRLEKKILLRLRGELSGG